MSEKLSPAQIDALRKLAGFPGFLGKRPRQTLDALERKGLVRHDRSVTPLGEVAARLYGWVPTDRQQQVIVALADGEVDASTAYHLGGDWPRAPASVVHRLANAGAAMVVAPGHIGRFKATNFGHELALILRQQELPPPPPVGVGGGGERAPA